MKKILIVCLLLLAIAPGVFAADGQVVTWDQFNGAKTVLECQIVWTAAAGGTKADYTLDMDAVTGIGDVGSSGWFLYQAETDPGATAPAANYDIVVNNASGRDLMAGTLANRHTSTTEIANVTAYSELITGDLTVQWADVSNANATGALRLRFTKFLTSP